ncbi:MAG: glycoside hydrolase family 99-like domain-containing protein [Clostridia bacterium]|nr:glycoside hydrolase family 99-like domain-containing protein [Clostridia bacterium]
MKKYDVAAYVWPSYTGDELRTRIFWPDGIGEWQTVKSAVKKFEGHLWPRKPVWGYVNEADAKVMEMQIDEATKHGVNVFIYDWYWYDKRPFLENCLNDGFLKAENNHKMRFYLMWANHNADYLWDKRNSHLDCMIWDAAVDRKEFEIIGKRLIEKYFTHPLYYKIEGKPVLSLFDVENLVKGLGGVKQAADAFDWLEEQAIKEGLNGVHYQLTLRNDTKFEIYKKEDGTPYTYTEVIEELGFDSLTHYQFCMMTGIDRDYNLIVDDVIKEWDSIDKKFTIPYFSHISVGWDNNLRFKEFKPGVTVNNTPLNVEKALMKAKEYIDNHINQPPLVVINSWNEWTEDSYLQPDDLYGYGYLEAIKKVFTENI